MELVRGIGSLIDRVRRDRISLVAGGVTFHWFLAVFPFLFAIVATIALADQVVSEDAVRTTIAHVTPAGADEFLTQVVTDARTETDPQGVLTILVAVAVALLSTSAGMASLLEGLEVASGAPRRSLVRRRLVALALVVMAIVVAGLGITAGVAIGNLPAAAGVVTAAHWTLAVLVASLVVRVVFIAGGTGGGGRLASTGSVTATAAIVVASVGLALFTRWFGGSFARTYGSFTSIVVLLLWFFAVAFAILAGAELDALRAPAPQGLSAVPPGITESRGKGATMDHTTESTTYRCDVCSETYSTEDELRRHWEAAHAAEVITAGR
jgi:membrane protein